MDVKNLWEYFARRAYSPLLYDDINKIFPIYFDAKKPNICKPKTEFVPNSLAF